MYRWRTRNSNDYRKRMKTVLITGSTRGIGKAIALEFAKNNYSVILNGTKENKSSIETFEKIKKHSPSSKIYYFDVSNVQQVERACREIINDFKTIDVLVNNAGIVKDKTLVKMDYEDWDLVIKTNLYGAFNTIKQILPNMVGNNWGRIINISSIIGLIGNFGQTNYSAAKSGLIGLTKSLAKETAKYNITVNAICPGLIETDILNDIPKEYLDKMIEKIPLKRLGKPEEIAKLVMFLSSEDASYITGQYININGGWL
jgi:3-oxoacyl-[acyl-carrier protein] reductase